jgi:hypothetical protein
VSSNTQPTRRALLASVGAATVPLLAGCVDDSHSRPNGSTTETPRRQSPTTDVEATPTTSVETTPTTSVETTSATTARTDTPVAAARVSTTIRWVGSPDAIQVTTPERDAFVSVRLPASLVGPSPDRFELHLGDDSYTAREFPGVSSETPTIDLRRGAQTPRWLLFDIRSTTTTAATLVAPDGRHARLPPSRLDRLDALPALRVETVRVPDEVTPDAELRITVHVRNDGDGLGTWLGGIQNRGVYYTPTVTVPPGETREATASPTVFGQSGSRIRLSLSWGRDSRLIEVPIRNHDTPA